jgi:hypothetical protein
VLPRRRSRAGDPARRARSAAPARADAHLQRRRRWPHRRPAPPRALAREHPHPGRDRCRQGDRGPRRARA